MLDWQAYIEIADKFQRKAQFEDRPDLRQDIITRLAELASNDGNKPLSKPSMLRVASYVVMEYWRDLKRLPDLYSLNDDVEDNEGNRLEIYQTLADDKAEVEAEADMIAEAKATLKVAKADLKQAKAKGNPDEITEAKQALKVAKANLKQAEAEAVAETKAEAVAEAEVVAEAEAEAEAVAQEVAETSKAEAIA